jgi:hypothetical protein
VQHLEPSPEPIRVEALLASGLVASPEIDVEDPQELLARGEGDDLTRIFQPPPPHDLLEDAGLKLRHDASEIDRRRPSAKAPAPPLL